VGRHDVVLSRLIESCKDHWDDYYRGYIEEVVANICALKIDEADRLTTPALLEHLRQSEQMNRRAWEIHFMLMYPADGLYGAALNPVTNELFWAGETGGAFCNDEPLEPRYPAELAPNSIILGPTNHHRLFNIDFPGRVYCLGAPIYQLCLVARGAASAMFFDPNVYVWDLALPSLLLERVGGVMVYASGRPVTMDELMDRRKTVEPIFAGGREMVEMLRGRVSYIGG
jgi:hypothetical protein